MTQNKQPQNLRQERGLAIAKEFEITKESDRSWKVPSQTDTKTFYIVKSNGISAECNCPDCKKGFKCKHIFAVEYIVTQTTYADGTLKQEITKKTYTQNWNSYDTAQKYEKEKFMKLLSDLVQNIEQENYNFGRPKSPISDILYSLVFKVYSGFSSRRFNSDLRFSQEKGFISCDVPRSTMSDYFNKEEVTQMLQELVKISSRPLSSIENDFAIDSSGIGTSNYQRWFSYKHGKDIRSKKWLKCHIVTGVKTNIIPSVKITSEFENDCPQLRELLNNIEEVFEIKEVSGDKAYLSRDNLNAINEIGAVPYIPFKSNTTGKTNRHGMFWKKSLHFFLYNQEEFMQHYHKRSNVETCFHMIKSKFGNSVKSKLWIGQVNETLCKVICHNICVVIQEMENLGIQGQLLSEKSYICPIIS
jgi:transposase